MLCIDDLCITFQIENLGCYPHRGVRRLKETRSQGSRLDEGAPRKTGTRRPKAAAMRGRGKSRSGEGGSGEAVAVDNGGGASGGGRGNGSAGGGGGLGWGGSGCAI